MSAYEGRRERLRRKLAEAGIEGLSVTAPSNVFYLSGFRGSSGALLVGLEPAVLFSDFRYRLQAKQQASGCDFMEIERRLLFSLGAEAARRGLRRLGYEQAHLTCELREELAEGAAGVELVPSGGQVEALRAVKTPAELDLMRAAAELADRALARMREMLQPGVTEQEIALEGEFLMRRQGAEAAAFDVIVASGPRSALPHAETTSRQLELGDLVVIDVGAKVAGYCSDMTRTFAVGRPQARAGEIYQIAYRAQRAAAERVRAGARCGDVDAVARGVIEAAGYGEDFGHGLGHGVGIDVHESPRLRRDEETVLAPGNVVTVEPGIYLEGFGGVRLEDLLAVGEDGAETLTGSPMPPELPLLRPTRG